MFLQIIKIRINCLPIKKIANLQHKKNSHAKNIIKGSKNA
jgi:hypothetical protein